MTKKKLIISIISILCAVALSVGVVLGIIEYMGYAKYKYTVLDTLPDGQGKRATVILLAGQSNAAGCSIDEYLRQNVSSEKYAEYEDGYDNVYINYYVTATNASNSFVKCTVNQGERGGYFGPELGMAEKLAEAYPDEMFFIIKYTWSASNLYEDWLSPTSVGRTGEKYKQLVRYVHTSMQYLRSKNYDVDIEGMCWMQGESDSFSVENATDYEVHLTNFIADTRREFGGYASSDIMFVDAYIADLPAYWVYGELVNRSKLAVSNADERNILIDTISEGLTTLYEPTGDPDRAHYDSASEIKLGHLFAQALAPYLD